jgi:hypothetical protein
LVQDYFFQFCEVKKVTTDVQNNTIISHHWTGKSETSEKTSKKVVASVQKLASKKNNGF